MYSTQLKGEDHVKRTRPRGQREPGRVFTKPSIHLEYSRTSPRPWIYGQPAYLVHFCLVYPLLWSARLYSQF